jgi:hypothetical protein
LASRGGEVAHGLLGTQQTEAFQPRQESVVAKDKDEARAEGFKRGLDGKAGNTGFTEGWTDDKAAGTARTEGYTAGKRKRSRIAAETAARAQKK